MASVVSSPPPPPKSSTSDEEDIEYEEIEEEIEVEEEVEVEEEIDEEEEVVDDDDDDMDIGEDLTPVRQENQHNDANQISLPEEHEEHIQSTLAAPVKSVSNPLLDIPIIEKIAGDLRTTLSSEKVQGERISGNNGAEPPSFNCEVNDVNTTTTSGDVNVVLAAADTSLGKNHLIASGETNFTVKALEDAEQISSRLHRPQTRLRDLSSSAEFNGENKRPRIACEFHAKGWCIKGSSCRFLHINEGLAAAVKKTDVLGREASSSACIPPQPCGEDPKLNSETKTFYAAPSMSGSLIDRKSTYQGNLSGYPGMHDSLSNTRTRASEATLEDMTSKKSNATHSDLRYTDLSHSRSRRPVSLVSSSWNTNGPGGLNLMGSGLDCHATESSSLKQNTSPFSAAENFPRNNIFRGTELAKYKTEISSSDDWVPSVPFRPSHVLTQKLLSKYNLYDPVRDSMEQTDARNGKFKFSHSDQGSSIKDVHMQSNHSQEEKLLNAVHAGDTVKDNILSSSDENKVKFDKLSDKREPGVDGSSYKNDGTNVDLTRDGRIRNESKALKYFEVALIEFVKELVKPVWREGLMSKDAHKLIVKKSVDKVLVTLEPHHIPDSAESIKSYLSSSQPKLAKLVEAYIEKYGKS